jgi:hypothetical protein
VTEEDEKALAEAIADELEDSAYGIEAAADRERTAFLVVDRIKHALYQQGWMPPDTYEQIQDWASRTGNLPEHHVNRDVLTSHLVELSAILHDR